MEFNLDSLNLDWIVGISDADFSRKVEECRQQLQSLHEAQKLQGVLISERDPIEFAAIFFAAFSIDFPIILANPNWGASECQQLEALVTPAIDFGGLGAALEANRPKAEPKLLAPGSILIPTGGTTGGVKLAIHDWSSLSAACAGVQRFLGGTPVDSCCLLPLYHVSGLMQLLRSFLSGGRIRFDDTDVTGYCVSLVPTQLQRLLGDPQSIEKLNTARAIFVGGAAMPATVAEKARAHRLPIIPVYGMTETAAMCAAVPTEDFLRGPSAGAVPIGNARFIVTGDGRIRIRTDALFKGYHGREPISLSRGYLTGDVGHIDTSGRLHVEGRADRIIISGGEKIDPREVEQAIEKLLGVEAALVVGLPDPEWGQKLVAFYTGTKIVGWKEKLQASLANYKIPKCLVWVDELPLDAKGKYAVTVGASLVKTAEAERGFPAVLTSQAPTNAALPIRKTQNLRIGRISIPGARYFITICSKGRNPSLIQPPLAQAVLDAWRMQHSDGDFIFHCGTLMPDHIHFLFTLGSKFSLGQSIIKFKAKTKIAMGVVGLEWQRDFYDHRLRANDAMEGFARYIFLNPYRKNLLSSSGGWPHWHLNRDYRPEFSLHLDDKGAPPAEWIAESIGAQQLIDTDMDT